MSDWYHWNYLKIKCASTIVWLYKSVWDMSFIKKQLGTYVGILIIFLLCS